MFPQDSEPAWNWSRAWGQEKFQMVHKVELVASFREAEVFSKAGRRWQGGCRGGHFNAAIALQGLPQHGPSCLEVGAWEPC